MKVNEANELRAQNRLLMEENARSRAFIERLLRHQAFTPFLEELSRDESLQAKAPMTSMPSTSTPVVTAPAPAQFQQQQQQQQFNGMSQAENTCWVAGPAVGTACGGGPELHATPDPQDGWPGAGHASGHGWTLRHAVCTEPRARGACPHGSRGGPVFGPLLL